MEKHKRYERTVFSVEAIINALGILSELVGDQTHLSTFMHIRLAGETWVHDSLEEFMADYRKDFDAVLFKWRLVHYHLIFQVFASGDTLVEVTAPTRREIEKVFDVFEKHAPHSRLPSIDHDASAPVIFIGHGGSSYWRDLKDHLHEKHGYRVEAYEIGARAGHAIRDVLEEMLDNSSFALLVMTAEDEQATGDLHPRLNVVHEAGLFQGSLGFSRAIILLEEGAKEFSNIHGLQQIRFSKGNIKETYGEVLATLRREFHRET